MAEPMASKLADNVETMCRDLVEDKDKVQKDESIMNRELWKPLAAVVLQVSLLRSMSKESVDKYDPFGDISYSVPLVASGLYLAFIYFGKKFMKNRKAFEIREYMFMYNLYQTIMNAWWVWACVQEVRSTGMNIWGGPVDRSPNGFRLGFLIWIHYQNKYIELLDTVFMVLRKKDAQISFLHVYHHCLILWAWFCVCKFACGGDAYFGALLNSFVHVIMYSYYLLALLKVSCPWKHHLTQVQMTQFVVCLCHSLWVLYYNTYPRILTGLEIFVMLNMLVLFGNFYKKQYIDRAKRNAAVAASSQTQTAVART